MDFNEILYKLKSANIENALLIGSQFVSKKLFPPDSIRFLLLFGLNEDQSGKGIELISIFTEIGFFDPKDVRLIRTGLFDPRTIFNDKMDYSTESFQEACRFGNEQLVKHLLQFPPTIEEKYLAFMFACESGNEKVVNLFDFDVNFVLDGRSPLNSACDYGRINIIKLLLSKGANINLKANVTPIQIACSENDKYDVVELLLENGADLNIVDDIGLIPLQRAVVVGAIECVKRLVSVSNVNHRDFYGRTSLQLAMEQDDHELKELLTENGAKY